MVRTSATTVALLAVFLGCSSPAVSPPAVDVEAEKATLLERDRAFAQAAGRGNLDSLLVFWTDDATVMMAGSPAVEGKAAIRQMVTQSMAIPGFSITWTPEDAKVASSGDMGYTTGTNAVTMSDSAGKASTMRGRYITVWRKEADGKWRVTEDYATPGPASPPGGAQQ
jgi:ketosteroid isomerase-like protein